ncbi:claudin-34 [Saimiri boliviensis]|uniref:claudin-34 n=1 Tax=Saimiri boliviensis TaxID=27679 RepID=UPI00027F7207|nr:claudin-34 [Saimiri boliviensis boliviensis]
MTCFSNNDNCGFSIFTLATVGWILSSMSMGLVEWRTWYVKGTPLHPPAVAYVGLFRVCIYEHHTNRTTAIFCYLYSSEDTFLPFEIHMAQYFLLTASIFGFVGRLFTIFALRNMSLGLFGGNTYNSFIVSGILNIAAGMFILFAVLQNYDAIISSKGINFPPSLQMPFKPDVQEVGMAIQVAGIAAFLMLLSGILSLLYRCSLYAQVLAEISEM